MNVIPGAALGISSHANTGSKEAWENGLAIGTIFASRTETWVK